MLVTKEEKCRKFKDGLNDFIQAYVIGFSHDDFFKIVTCALNVERVKKEDRVRKTPASQVLICTRIRNLKDHNVLISLQLKLPVARPLY